MRKEEMERLAQDAGFTNMGVIPADHLVFEPPCGSTARTTSAEIFGKNLSCPPACGTPEDMKKSGRRLMRRPGFFRLSQRWTGTTRKP